MGRLGRGSPRSGRGRRPWRSLVVGVGEGSGARSQGLGTGWRCRCGGGAVSDRIGSGLWSGHSLPRGRGSSGWWVGGIDCDWEGVVGVVGVWEGVLVRVGLAHDAGAGGVGGGKENFGGVVPYLDALRQGLEGIPGGSKGLGGAGRGSTLNGVGPRWFSSRACSSARAPGHVEAAARIVLGSGR